MRGAELSANRPVPLCVDLDGTLIRTDTLHEATLQLLRQKPFALAKIAAWLTLGKPALKYRIADSVRMEVLHLPYRKEVLDLIEQARAERRPVLLVTAAAPQVAQAVADYLGLFDEVLSSSEGTNLAGQVKALQLAERFGEGGFDYVGNCKSDLPVWRRARRVIIVSPDKRLHARAASTGQLVHIISEQPQALRLWLKSLRPHQWLKNLLVFVPLFAGQVASDRSLLLNALLAFVAFSLAASAVYLVNDLADLPSDRCHRSKHRRPFASGGLPIVAGVITAPILLIAAMLVSLMLPMLFMGVLGSYLLLTSAYSLRLKRQVVLDVMLLAGLYTLRIIAGSAAIRLVPSFWLLAFSMFTFLSLALVKRYSELQLAPESMSAVPGRGYAATDLPVLIALGASSALMSVLVLALYINSPAVTAGYREPLWLWLVPPAMLYWSARLWMKAHRGEVHDDPVVFAATDLQSLIVLLILGIDFVAAVTGLRFW